MCTRWLIFDDYTRSAMLSRPTHVRGRQLSKQIKNVIYLLTLVEGCGIVRAVVGHTTAMTRRRLIFINIYNMCIHVGIYHDVSIPRKNCTKVHQPRF